MYVQYNVVHIIIVILINIVQGKHLDKCFNRI